MGKRLTQRCLFAASSHGWRCRTMLRVMAASASAFLLLLVLPLRGVVVAATRVHPSQQQRQEGYIPAAFGTWRSLASSCRYGQAHRRKELHLEPFKQGSRYIHYIPHWGLSRAKTKVCLSVSNNAAMAENTDDKDKVPQQDKGNNDNDKKTKTTTKKKKKKDTSPPSYSSLTERIRQWRKRPRPWILYDKVVRVCRVPGTRVVDRSDEMQLIRTFLALWVDVVAYDPSPLWIRLRPGSPFRYDETHVHGMNPALVYMWNGSGANDDDDDDDDDNDNDNDNANDDRDDSDDDDNDKDGDDDSDNDTNEESSVDWVPELANVNMELPPRAEAAAAVTLKWCRFIVADLQLCPWAQASLDFTEVPHENENFPAGAIRIKVVPAEWGWKVFETVVRESATELLQLTGFLPPLVDDDDENDESNSKEDYQEAQVEMEDKDREDQGEYNLTNKVERDEMDEEEEVEEQQDEEEIQTVNAELVGDDEDDEEEEEGEEEGEKEEEAYMDDQDEDEDEDLIFLEEVDGDDDDEDEDEEGTNDYNDNDFQGLFDDDEDNDDDDDDPFLYEVRTTPAGEVFSAFPLVDPNLAITFVVAAPMTTTTATTTTTTTSRSMEEWTENLTPEFDFQSFYQLATNLEEALLDQADQDAENPQDPQWWSDVATGHHVTLAPFHPHWQFAAQEEKEENKQEALNYEKRTPLPTISLVRTSAIEAAGGPAATQRIGNFNQKVLMDMGVTALQKLYRDKVYTAASRARAKTKAKASSSSSSSTKRQKKTTKTTNNNNNNNNKTTKDPPTKP